jgi:apolipoprotein N-acyltransferase
MRLWIRILLCLLSSVLCFLAFTGYDQWYLALVSWVPVFIAVEGLGLRRTFLLTWLFGTLAHFGGYYWLPQTIITFGEFPVPLAYLFALVLNAYQGLAFAIIGTLRNWLRLRGHESIFLAAAALAAVEQLYPRLFPIYWGNTFYKVLPACQCVDLFGVIFLSFLIILFNLAVTNLIQVTVLKSGRLQLRALIVVALLWAANLVYGGVRLSTVRSAMEKAETIRVGVVQGNLTMHSKHNKPREGLLLHRAMSLELEKQGVDLFVWSESSVNYSIPTDMKKLKNAVLGDVSTPTLFGAIRVERGGERDRDFNTAFLVDGDGNLLGTYDKIYLLAFGEYLPLGETFPRLYEWTPNTGQFTKGRSYDAIPFNGRRLGVLICYEDILPGLVRKMVSASGGGVDMLVNITNDSWFGDTAEPWIHLGLSTYRSIEHRQWLLRATNSGVSAAVDPTGKIVKTTGVMKEAAFIVKAGFMSMRTLYQMGGWLFGWACVAVVIGFLIFRKRGAGTGTGPEAATRAKPKAKKKKRRK